MNAPEHWDRLRPVPWIPAQPDRDAQLNIPPHPTCPRCGCEVELSGGLAFIRKRCLGCGWTSVTEVGLGPELVLKLAGPRPEPEPEE